MTCFLLFYLLRVKRPIFKFSISKGFGTYYILRESPEQGENESEIRFSNKKSVVKIFEKWTYLKQPILGQISRCLFRSISGHVIYWEKAQNEVRMNLKSNFQTKISLQRYTWNDHTVLLWVGNVQILLYKIQFLTDSPSLNLFKITIKLFNCEFETRMHFRTLSLQTNEICPVE